MVKKFAISMDEDIYNYLRKTAKKQRMSLSMFIKQCLLKVIKIEDIEGGNDV